MTNIPGKTVLVLGAGASFVSKFQLPVMAGFFGPHREDFTDLFEFLEWFYPEDNLSQYNLEDVLAFLTISRNRMIIWDMPPNAKPSVNYDKLYLKVLQYIHRRLEIPKDGVCQLHKQLFSMLDPKDSVLTLNYDLVADQALYDLAPKEHDHPEQNSRIGKLAGLLCEQSLFGSLQPPSLMPREEKQGFYLKLHGSLDWLRCPTLGCRNHINIFCCGLSRLPDGQLISRPCRFCGAALEAMIVPPITTKRLEDRGRIAFLWNLALRELRDASRIVFIGVSLAPTDFELRWLIREAIGFKSKTSIQIQVINPNKSHRKAILSIIPSVQCEVKEYDCLKDYFKEHEERETI